MKSRYLSGVLILTAFVVVAFATHWNIHKKMEEDFEIINISGRQRMLSQKLALLSSRSSDSEIVETMKQFRAGQQRLLKTRFVDERYPEILDLYSGPNGISVLAARLLDLVARPSFGLVNHDETFRVSQEVLQKYDRTTSIIQQISEATYRDQLRNSILILIATMVVLILKFFVIFRPMVFRVRSTFDELNQIEKESSKNARLLILGEIAANIGHEIKNPLNVVTLAVASLKTADGDAREKMLNLIERGCHQVNRIVKSMAVQSRETSRDPMEKTTVQYIVDDSLDLFEFKLRKHNIAVEKNIGTQNVTCRPGAISQVVTNLIGNAIDALVNNTANLNKIITVESGRSHDEKYIYIRIMDSGPGVPIGHEESVFESFFTTKSPALGTGLGLSVSRKIIEEHQGQLSLNSEISRSCFEIILPAEPI